MTDIQITHPDFEVVRFNPGDAGQAAQLADVAIRSFAATFGAETRGEDLIRMLGDRTAAGFIDAAKTHNIWVARDRIFGDVNGFAQSGGPEIPEVLDGEDEDVPIEEVSRVYVDPLMLGRGIGGLLLGTALKDIDSRGIHRTYLQVKEDNKPAINLYRKHRFLRSVYGYTQHMTDYVPHAKAKRDVIMVRSLPNAA